VASTLFGSRISARVAERTFAELSRAGINRIVDAGTRDQSDLVALLDAGGYARYDFRTSARLQALARVITERYGGEIGAIGRHFTAPRTLVAALDELPGWGPVTIGLFLRELRRVVATRSASRAGGPSSRADHWSRARRARQHHSRRRARSMRRTGPRDGPRSAGPRSSANDDVPRGRSLYRPPPAESLAVRLKARLGTASTVPASPTAQHRGRATWRVEAIRPPVHLRHPVPCRPRPVPPVPRRRRGAGGPSRPPPPKGFPPTPRLTHGNLDVVSLTSGRRFHRLPGVTRCHESSCIRDAVRDAPHRRSETRPRSEGLPEGRSALSRCDNPGAGDTCPTAFSDSQGLSNLPVLD